MDRELVELTQGTDRWYLAYTDHKDRRTVLAEYSFGPIQALIMVQAARQVMKFKLLDNFDIVASAEAVDRLCKLVPDLIPVYDGDDTKQVAA